MFYVIGEVRG